MKYISTKTYGNEVGLSCCFRQWRAKESHCSLLHGYAIGAHFEFGSNSLDEKNWVYDFGGCKWIKEFLQLTFDHKTIIANDDPKKTFFLDLKNAGVIDLVILPDVGCEKFAEYVFKKIAPVVDEVSKGRVHLLSVKIFEHSGNSASYLGDI